jgi:hypothetical protein
MMGEARSTGTRERPRSAGKAVADRRGTCRARQLGLAALVAFGVVACDATSEIETPARENRGGSTPESAGTAVVTSGPPGVLTDAEVARSLEEEDALAREDARIYEERRASMAGRERCVEQAESADAGLRPRLLAACDRLSADR